MYACDFIIVVLPYFIVSIIVVYPECCVNMTVLIICHEGAGDSGKSTIAKQMKIIHLDGFNEEERLCYKTTIANNILTAMRTLIHQANKFDYHLSTGNEVNRISNHLACLPALCLCVDILESSTSNCIHTTRPRTSSHKRDRGRCYELMARPCYQTNLCSLLWIPTKWLYTIVRSSLISQNKLTQRPVTLRT